MIKFIFTSMYNYKTVEDDGIFFRHGGDKMNLICESACLDDYLAETEEVDFSHPAVAQCAEQLAAGAKSGQDYAQAAFEFVRDRISHSWDIRSHRVTRTASEVLRFEEGICYAKANLLCALLRRQGIPAGFCYQRLTLGDTPDTGYVIHALNAVYLAESGRWIRLDARGNKEGVDAQFSLGEEKLAFSVRKQYGEKDYGIIHSRPAPATMAALRRHTDCINMCLHGLPTEL